MIFQMVLCAERFETKAALGTVYNRTLVSRDASIWIRASISGYISGTFDRRPHPPECVDNGE